MFVQTSQRLKQQMLAKAVQSVDLTAPENAAFIEDFSRARKAGLLLNWDISEYVQQRRKDSGMHRRIQ